MGASSGLDHTRGLLTDVGFEFAVHVIPERVERGVREKVSLSGFLDLVLTTERDAREERREKTPPKLSAPSAAKNPERSDFPSAPGVAPRRCGPVGRSRWSRPAAASRSRAGSSACRARRLQNCPPQAAKPFRRP